MKTEKVYLMILDGFGEGKNYKGNAIKKAHMPVFHELLKKYPSTLLKAAGNEVGLPRGAMGNSEVGHYTIGAGRITYQSYEEINRSIKKGTFFKKKPLLSAIKKAKKNGVLHLIGMISNEGVHAHIDHMFALLKLAKQHKVKQIYIHAITDGRDVAERSADIYIKKIQKKIVQMKLNKATPSNPTTAKIATIIGRFYAMDRDHNWKRTQKAYDLYTLGKGTKEKDPLKAIKNAYKRGADTDYYIDPIILDENSTIKDHDAVIFFNFRTDRPRQLTYCFTGEEKIGFKPKKKVRPDLIVFGEYSEKAPVVFPSPRIKNNLGSTLDKHKKSQLHIAETEKYAHVTFFFNSQEENPYKKEKRIMVNSPKVPSYAQTPEMSALEVTNKAINALNKGNFDFIIQNFANGDLVGHSGDFKATKKACEVLDQCIEKIYKKTLEKGYHLMITSDHGNAEYMTYSNEDQCPSHTTNPVPFILVSKKLQKAKLRKNCGLKNVAPTILEIMNIQKPKEMKAKSLISK